MKRALELAAQGLGITNPNPTVGCVLVNPDGQIIGQGHTQAAGGAHAEIMALRDAASHGMTTAHATAYVTLEPCSHFGRTAPCCDALITAGIKKVVASTMDPNPRVAGTGFEKLRIAGIEVVMGYGAEQSQELNIGFFSRMIRNKPWVRMKIAMSLDGKMGLKNGESQWITSETSRLHGQRWRARSCAIMTGVGTILADDPWLNIRNIKQERQPDLVIIDSHLRTPANAKVLDTERRTYIYTAAPSSAFSHKNSHIISTQSMTEKSTVVNLKNVLDDLCKKDINEIHLEAGPTLNGAFLQENLVDEFLIYIAPKIIGPGLEVASMPALQHLRDAKLLQIETLEKIDGDIFLRAKNNSYKQ